MRQTTLILALLFLLVGATAVTVKPAAAQVPSRCSEAAQWAAKGGNAADAADHYTAFLDFQQAVEAYGDCSDSQTGAGRAKAAVLKAAYMVMAGIQLKLNGDDDDVPKAQELYRSGMEQLSTIRDDPATPPDVKTDAQKFLTMFH